jgi:hypothetical protein
MTKHAKLSASSSERWIRCGGSRKAEEDLPDVQNKFSEEGTLAHEIAAALLNKQNISNYDISSEMMDNIQLYIDYVKTIASENIYYPETYIEKQVYFPHVVSNGFGTADCIIVSINTLHVIDFKYGIGHSVSAHENTQLLLYAMGAYKELKNKDVIHEIVLHIVQPRKNNFDKWSISIKELLYWEGYIKAKAEIALRDDALRIPSEKACRWCKARTICPAIYDFTSDVINVIQNEVDDNKIKIILNNSKMIKNYLNSIEEKVYNKLSSGQPFPGYKLVEGRNMRKIKTDCEDKLVELLGEKAYIKSLIRIPDLEKLVDKETLESFIYVSKSKPLMVAKDDKRKALKVQEFDFTAIDEDVLL